MRKIKLQISLCYHYHTAEKSGEADFLFGIELSIYWDVIWNYGDMRPCMTFYKTKGTINRLQIISQQIYEE